MMGCRVGAVALLAAVAGESFAAASSVVGALPVDCSRLAVERYY